MQPKIRAPKLSTIFLLSVSIIVSSCGSMNTDYDPKTFVEEKEPWLY